MEKNMNKEALSEIFKKTKLTTEKYDQSNELAYKIVQLVIDSNVSYTVANMAFEDANRLIKNLKIKR